MKKIILRILPIVLILSIFSYMPSKAKNNNLPLPPEQLNTTIFEKYNKEKFIAFVEKNEGFKISDEGIEVKETKDIITVVDKRNPDSISVISSKD